MRASLCICAVADDLGLALASLLAQVQDVLRWFDAWAQASAPALNPAECALIPAADHGEAQALLDTILGSQSIRLQGQAKYLGVAAGPHVGGERFLRRLWPKLEMSGFRCQALLPRTTCSSFM